MAKYKCVFCSSEKLSEVVNFGDVAIAGAFLKKEEISSEKKYPLVIVFCENCYAVQVRDHIDPEILFKTDFYFSSAIKTLVDHFTGYAKNIVDRFIPNPAEAVTLEFGSNDGVLLKPVADLGVGTVIGIDPAENIVESIDDSRLELINDFFNTTSAKAIVGKYGKVDVVMANNVFAHITGINDTTDAVEKVLKDDGVFVFEVHYLGKILEEMQYDFIYHEHTYYYSLLALENHLSRHGMVIFDIEPIPIHGGSIRYYAAKRGSMHAGNISAKVKELHKKEIELGYDKSETYGAFAKNIAETKTKLMDIISKAKGEGKTVIGYGASGRANTIIQYCGITNQHLDYIVDDAPAKQGLVTPGSHIPIKDNTTIKSTNPDFVLIFAWAFYKEIAAKLDEYLKQGGKLIVPLPEVRMVTSTEVNK